MISAGRLLSAISLGLLSFTGQLFSQSQQLQVTVRSGATTTVAVRVPYEFTYSANRPGGQGRIVVDITSAKASIDPNEALRTVPVGNRLVREVLIGAFKPGATRLVVVLSEQSRNAPFNVSRFAGRRGLQIQVGASGPPAKDARAASKGETTGSVPKTDTALALKIEPKTQVTTPPAPPTQENLGPNSPVPPLRAFHLPARIGIVKEVPLTLAEALNMAIANNPDFQAARVDVAQAGYRVIGASGVYVPNFNWLGSYGRQTVLFDNLLAGSAVSSATNHWWHTVPSIAGSSPRYGGNYEVAFSADRFTTTGPLANLNPSYPNVVSLRYSQPLWRNLRYDSNRYAIEVARRNRQIIAETLRQRVSQIIYETEQAYWELTFTRREVAVQLRALETARQQENNNRRQLDRGSLTPLDIVASQTQVTNFEIALYSAQDALTRAENTLKNLILGDRSAVLWDSAISPTSDPEVDFAMPELTEAVKEAVAQRPEAARLRIASDINQADERLRREQTKPQVDLIASYSRVALAGTQVSSPDTRLAADYLSPALLRLNQLSALAGLGPVTASGASPGTLFGGYGRSLNDLFHRDVPTTEIQLRFSIPLSSRAVRANLEESLAEGRRLVFKRRSIEQAIESDVRNALQGIDSARRRLHAARASSVSAEEQFRNEQRRFEMGESTLFLVQQRQLAMVASLSQVNRAEADSSEAISLLEFAQGANYQRHNIDIK